MFPRDRAMFKYGVQALGISPKAWRQSWKMEQISMTLNIISASWIKRNTSLNYFLYKYTDRQITRNSGHFREIRWQKVTCQTISCLTIVEVFVNQQIWMCIFLVRIVNLFQALLPRPWSQRWKCCKKAGMCMQVQGLMSWAARFLHVLPFNHLYHAASLCLRQYTSAKPLLQKCLIMLLTHSSKDLIGFNNSMTQSWWDKCKPPLAANQHYPHRLMQDTRAI